MDRVVGRKGCAFSALIALKLFGEKKRRGWRKNINFDDALDEMLAEESGEDDFIKPYQWKVLLFWLKLFYSFCIYFRTKPYKPGMTGWNKGQYNNEKGRGKGKEGMGDGMGMKGWRGSQGKGGMGIGAQGGRGKQGMGNGIGGTRVEQGRGIRGERVSENEPKI